MKSCTRALASLPDEPSNDSSKSHSPGHWPQGWWVVVGVAVLAALVLWGSSALVARWNEGGVFWEEIGLDRPVGFLCAYGVLLAPLLSRFGRGGGLQRFWRSLAAPQRLAVVAVACTLSCALLLNFGFGRLAFTPDEQCAVLQARTFAAGHLTARVAPDLLPLVTPRWMQDDFFALSRATGVYTATYWPGYALLLTPFAAFGAEWLLNPTLTGLTIIGVFALARRLTRSNEAGWWAVAITALSAQIVLHGASFFSMPAHLLSSLWFCLLLARNTRRATFAVGLLGGFALILHNPAPHFSFALPWIVWLAARRRDQLPGLLLGYALVALPLGWGWSAHLQGFDPSIYATSHAAGGDGQIASRIARSLHLPDALLLLARGAGLAKLIVWAMPGAAAFAGLGWLQARRALKTGVEVEPLDGAAPTRADREMLCLLGASLAFNFALYFAVSFDQGHGWGFRYLHQSWLALPILGGAFLAQASPAWKKSATVCAALGALVVLPLHAREMIHTHAWLLERRPVFPAHAFSISFVREGEVASTDDVWIQNDPFLRNPHWMLRFQTPGLNALVARRHLRNARRGQTGPWGETWSGTGFQ